MSASIVYLANIRRGRLTVEEREHIEALAERGFSAGRIAQKLNRHPATINFAMVTRGLRAASTRVRGICRRGDVEVHGFGPEEDAFIEALRIQGYTYQKIADVAAKRFGHQRSAATIGIRLKMLASREAS